MGSAFSCFGESNEISRNDSNRAVPAVVKSASDAPKVDTEKSKSSVRPDISEGGVERAERVEDELSEKPHVDVVPSSFTSASNKSSAIANAAIPTSASEEECVIDQQPMQSIDAGFHASKVPLPPSPTKRASTGSSLTSSARDRSRSRSRSHSPDASTAASFRPRTRRDSAAPSSISKQSVAVVPIDEEVHATPNSPKELVTAPTSPIMSVADTTSMIEGKLKAVEAGASTAEHRTTAAVVGSTIASSKSEIQKPQLGITIFPHAPRRPSYEDDPFSASTVTPTSASPRKYLLRSSTAPAPIPTVSSTKIERRGSRVSRFLSMKRTSTAALTSRTTKVLEKTEENALQEALAALEAGPRLEGRTWKEDTDNESLFCY